MTDGVFAMVLDSLRNKNVQVFHEKWFSVKSESFCKIIC
jgi:hypothetical protein